MDADIAIIGAGVVGLACGAALARRGWSVVLLERNSAVGRETSSRNSGVIHGGLYYPAGSLKARTCVAGRIALYERCTRLQIPHRKCGKLVVAVDDAEISLLESIYARAIAAGCDSLKMLDRHQLARLEPEISAVAALWSPETGIVDAYELVRSYLVEAKEHGATLCVRTRVAGLEMKSDGWRVNTRSPEHEVGKVHVRAVVNAAGLESERVAQYAALNTNALGYRLYYCKGDYFALAPSLSAIATHLVYPVPVSAGLGIHLTFDLGGKYLGGPDTEYIIEPTYGIDPTKAEQFAASMRRYLPRIKAEHLSPDFAGIRPKLQGPDEPFRDFVIEDAAVHGKPGLINLIGIESPGLTASGAIALEVERMLEVYLQ